MSNNIKTKQKKIAIALQGGGSHGSFAWGVLDRLLEDERFSIEGISGTSAGGMNAVAYLQGFAKNGNEGARESLYNFWKTLSEISLLSPYKPTLLDQMVGYFNLDHSMTAFMAHKMIEGKSPYQWNPSRFNPLDLLIKRCFQLEPLRTFTKSKVFLCATHVATGKLKIFTNKDLSKEVLLASSCLPRLFHAVKVGEEFYWDGGYAGNPAIFPLIDGCETSDILVIQLTRQHCPKVPMSYQEIEDRLMEINNNLSLLREMRAIHFITQLIDSGAVNKPLKRLHMHIIRNEIVFSPLAQQSSLNSDWKFIEYLFHWGRKTADIWIKDHFDDIGIRSSAHIEDDFVKEE